MISVTVFQKDDHIQGICLSGHADYADAGEDIVCAAVSALAINALNSIEAFTEDSFTEDFKEEDAYLSFMMTDQISPKSELLLLSLVLGLQGVAQENTDYITLTYKEV